MRISDWSSDVCSSDLPVDDRLTAGTARQDVTGDGVVAATAVDGVGTGTGEARHVVAGGDELGPAAVGRHGVAGDPVVAVAGRDEIAAEDGHRRRVGGAGGVAEIGRAQV